MTNFPGAIDDATTLPDPQATDRQDEVGVPHDELHRNENAAIIAVETYLIGAGATVGIVSSGSGPPAAITPSVTTMTAIYFDESNDDEYYWHTINQEWRRRS